MRIGKNGSKSKTEALYIPPLGTTALSDIDRNKVFIDSIYQGYVTFNRRFTYLGTIISNDLEDSAEIHTRIGKAYGGAKGCQ
jgi:hypothetical protein